MKNLKRKIAQMKIIRKISESKGTIINDTNKCVYCGLCHKVCSIDAISVSNDSKSWNIEHNLCVRCTHCVSICPKNSLTLLSNK